jgi:uncharacterized membrane protein
MPSDNVTPFRRPPRRVQQKQQQGGLGFKTHRGKAVLIHILTLVTYALAYFFPFPAPPGSPIILVVASCISLAFAFMAIALAMPNRYDGMPWAATHHEHAIRTLFIGFAVWTLSSALSYINGALIVVAIYAHLAVLAWVAIRSGVGMVLALMRKPIPHPRGWLL